MAILFPTTLDTLSNPTVNSNLSDVGVEHHVQHANSNDAIEVLETKVGINNSVDVNSIDYKIRQLQPKVSFTSAPTTATDIGVAGTVVVAGGYIHVCIATNSWVRTTIAAW